MLRAVAWGLVLGGVVSCTEITIVRDPAETDGGDAEDGTSVGGNGSGADGSGAGGSGAGGAASPACDLVLDWTETVPNEHSLVGIVGFSRLGSAVEMLTVEFFSGHADAVTTSLHAFGPGLVVGTSTPREVSVDTQSLRSTALAEGGFELATLDSWARLPPAPTAATIEDLGDGVVRVGWDRAGGRYVARGGLYTGVPFGPVVVERPDGSTVDLGTSCSAQVHSAVADGVIVRLDAAADCDDPEVPQTWFVGPDGAWTVDLENITAFGRGAGDRTLGIGFGGHIYDIGPSGALGEIVATNPADGGLYGVESAEIVPWLEGFAVVLMDTYPESARGIRVRAYPGYGPAIDSERLEDANVGQWPLAFASFPDDASRSLLVAYQVPAEGLATKLARFSCKESP